MCSRICLVDGPVYNWHGAPWDALVETVGLIRPLYAQFYPVDRPTPESWVEKLSHDEVARRATEMQARTGVPCEPY